MTDPAHTALPWWIDDDGFIAAGSGDDYQTVADPHCRPTVDYGDENGANADFILRACNGHYALLAALENLVKAIGFADINDPGISTDEALKAIQNARRPQ